MAYDTSFIIKDLTTVSVLFFIFIIIYAKFTKQTIREAFRGFKESLAEFFGIDNETQDKKKIFETTDRF